MKIFILLAALLIPTISFGSVSKSCFTLSKVKSFGANDSHLPLLCVYKKRNHTAKTQIISVQKRIGNSGFGSSEYVAKLKAHPLCRHCNKSSFKLMGVNYDSPYLVFNGHKSRYGEYGYLVLRGEGYYYSSTNRM
jgi:hypothetical protein